MLTCLAFFIRALKTKHDTPKYGLIYHASMVGASNPKNRGKVNLILEFGFFVFDFIHEKF